MENKNYDDVLESHRKIRECTNPECLNKHKMESTTRFMCWYCGVSLKEVKIEVDTRGSISEKETKEWMENMFKEFSNFEKTRNEKI